MKERRIFADATSAGRPPLTGVPRIHLPVLVDRRLVLRGMAVTLLAALTGCANDVRAPSGDEPPDVRPDAGPGDPPPPPPPPASTGFEQCGAELCITLAAPANAALRVIDGARVITIDGRRILIIRIAADQFLALSAACTHTGCTVRYAPVRADIECPCHGSTFGLDGAVTHGPAASPLATFGAAYDPAADVVRVMLG